MIKGSVQEEDITNYIYVYIYTHTPNIGAPQYIRQKLAIIKEKIDCNTIIVGDFNTHSLQRTEHADRKLIRK